MNREDIIRMAREAGFVVDELSKHYQPNCITHTYFLVDELLERFAAIVAAEVDKNWVQGKAKINVPTATMEQEFNNYHRLGYKAGAAAEREACAKLCETEFCGDDVAYYVATAIRARGEK